MSAGQLQLRRGIASLIAAFTGALGELVVDTTNNRLVLNDGATAGGWPHARISDVSAIMLPPVSVPLNTTGDTPIAIPIALAPGFSRYQIDKVLISKASVAPSSTCRVGLYTAASQGGVALASQQAINAITATAESTVNNMMALTLNNVNALSLNLATLYFNIGTADGANKTVEVSLAIKLVS